MPWKIRTEGSYVLFTFSGLLTGLEARRCVAALEVELGHGPRHLIFDVRDMDDFDTESRTVWQEALRPRRDRLLDLCIVGGNPIVRMGAAVLGTSVGLVVRKSDRLPDAFAA